VHAQDDDLEVVHNEDHEENYAAEHEYLLVICHECIHWVRLSADHAKGNAVNSYQPQYFCGLKVHVQPVLLQDFHQLCCSHAHIDYDAFPRGHALASQGRISYEL